MNWKRNYPEYPDLTSGALGDCGARLEWLDRPPTGGQTTDEEYTKYREELELYWASKLMLFVEAIDAGNPVDPRIMKDLRDAFNRVLEGTVWEDSIPLPGREFKDEWYAYSPITRRDQELCFEVLVKVSINQEKVTEAIAAVALENNRSFETVRTAYYRWKKWHEEIRERSKFPSEKLED